MVIRALLHKIMSNKCVSQYKNSSNCIHVTCYRITTVKTLAGKWRHLACRINPPILAPASPPSRPVLPQTRGARQRMHGPTGRSQSAPADLDLYRPHPAVGKLARISRGISAFCRFYSFLIPLDFVPGGNKDTNLPEKCLVCSFSACLAGKTW